MLVDKMHVDIAIQLEITQKNFVIFISFQNKIFIRSLHKALCWAYVFYMIDLNIFHDFLFISLLYCLCFVRALL